MVTWTTTSWTRDGEYATRMAQAALTLNPYRDIGYMWVRAHIGIRGTELADKRPDYEFILGDSSGATQIATTEGIRARSRAARKEARTTREFGTRKTE